ncbi:hypothetical protein TcBrA4_0051800 [Trypanosoma cruzi]|nr:hypothetical protein TcBrA4_0051800 [Trypanosoma cruzi]
MIKSMKKRFSPFNQSHALPQFSLHINASSDDTWVSIVVYLPKYQTMLWGGRTGQRASPTARSRVVQIACLHDWSGVPQRTLLCGVRRGIPRNQRSLHVSSRKIRKLSLRRSVLHNVVVSNASCPRILTNRKARRESALAVLDATDQSKIMLPSGSSVKLLG